MNQSHHRLTKLAALASVVGLMACGGNESAPPNTASSENQNQYGATNPQSNEQQSAPAPSASSSTEGYSGAGSYYSDGGSTQNGQSGSQGYSGAPSTMGTSSPSTSSGQYGSQGSSTQYGSQGGSSDQYGSQGMSGQSGSPGMTGQSGSQGSTGQSGTQGSSQQPYSSSGSSAGGDQSGATLTDAQLDGALQALNQGEIQAGQLAMTKSTNPAVKRFAQHMVTEHRDMENKANAAFSRAQVTAADSEESRHIKMKGQNELSSLQGQSGHDFDVAYVDAQVKGHNHALELLDRALPNVRHTELKSALQASRTRIEEHLREAEHLQQQLQMGNTNTQGGTNPSHSNQNNQDQNNQHDTDQTDPNGTMR